MSDEGMKAIAGGVIAVLAIGIIAGVGFVKNTHRVEHQACAVQEKDRAANNDGGSDMRVYTSCGIFTVKDSFWAGQWDSADVYQSIVVGSSYDFESTGWRVPFLSWFPNIVEADEAKR